MDRFETKTALKLSDGFEAVGTILKLARLFWNQSANANGFKAGQGNPCLLSDHFKAVCSDGMNPLKTSVRQSPTAFNVVMVSMAS